MLHKSIILTITLAVFSSLFSSCTFQGLIFRNLDWLVVRQINQNFKLSREQRREFEPRIRELVEELKGVTVDGLIEVLTEVKKASASGNINDEAFFSIEKKLEQLAQSFIEQTIPDMAKFFSAMEDAQLRRFLSRMSDRNDWIRNLAEASEANFPKELQKALDKSYERYRNWLGALRPEQKQMIQSYWPQSPAKANIWYQSRAKQQRTFVEICIDSNQDELLSALRKWQKDPDWLKKRAGVSQDTQSFRDFLFSFRQSLSAEQLQHLSEKAGELIQDLQRLNNS